MPKKHLKINFTKIKANHHANIIHNRWQNQKKQKIKIQKNKI